MSVLKEPTGAPSNSIAHRGRERLHINLRNLVSDLAQARSNDEQIKMLLTATSTIFQSDVSMVYVLKDANRLLYPHVSVHVSDRGNQLTPVPVDACCRRILNWPFRWPSDDHEPALLKCQFFGTMDGMGFSTWFSLPLSINGIALGMIAVGYYRYQYLVDDVGQILWEFAQDVAYALVPHLPEEINRAISRANTDAVSGPYQQRMRRLLSNHYQLTNALWADDDLPAIAQCITQMLHHPTAVLDRFQSTLCTYPQDHSWNNALLHFKDWLSRSSLFRQNAAPLPVRTDPINGTTFVVAPIRMGNVLHGYLVIWESESKLDDLDLIAVQEATIVLAVHFYKRGLHIERRGHGFQELFNLLLDQPDAWGKAQSEEALALGWDTGAEQCILIGLPNGHEPNLYTAFSEHLPVLVDHLRARMEAYYPEVLVVRRQGALTFIIPVTLTSETNLHRLLDLIQATDLDRRTEFSNTTSRSLAKFGQLLKFGLSSPARHAKQLVNAFDEAYFACRLAPLIAPDARYVSGNDVRIYRLLRPLAKSRFVQQFVYERLNALREYDARHDAELLKTLRVYLQHNGNLSDTASTLYIHRTSLQYRLKRIEAIVGQSLDSAEVRFEMQLALIFGHLLVLEEPESGIRTQ